MKLPVTEIMCAICLFQLRAIQFINNFVELPPITKTLSVKGFKNAEVSVESQLIYTYLYPLVILHTLK